MALVVALSHAGSAPGRTWSDDSGKFTIEAEYVAVEGASVVLRTPDGKELRVPLSKLSQADRKHVSKLLSEASRAAAGSAAKPDAAAADAVRAVAKQFYGLMSAEDRAGFEPLLTAAGRKTFAGGSSPVQGLPRTDEGRAPRLGKVSVDDDAATVQARVVVAEEQYPTTLHLKREGGGWKVAALVVDQDGGEKRIDFEQGSADQSGGGELRGPGMEGRTADGEEPPADSNSFEVPQGSPEQLLAFIEEVGKRSPPENVDRREYIRQALGAIVAAAEQILLAEDVPPALAQRAIGHEGNALRTLAQLDPGQAMRQATQLQQHVQRLKLADLERPVAGLVLQVRLLGARSPAEAEQTLADITSFAAEGPLGPAEMQLVATAGQIAGQLPGDAALNFHREVGQRLADSGDAAAQQLGAQMLGSARRMGLVGDSMRLEGVGLDGSKFDPSVLDGKVVLVDFWATWCGPCIAEMDNIRQNYARYHDRGFEVVGVSVDQNLADLEKFMGENDVPWIILADNHAKVPESERLGSYYGISAIPTTILIGRDGKVITLQCRGPQLAELLEKHL